jgi:hypothetical protein
MEQLLRRLGLADDDAESGPLDPAACDDSFAQAHWRCPTGRLSL